MTCSRCGRKITYMGKDVEGFDLFDCFYAEVIQKQDVEIKARLEWNGFLVKVSRQPDPFETEYFMLCPTCYEEFWKWLGEKNEGEFQEAG